MTEEFLAVCPNYWGRGKSVEAAKKRMRQAGGTLRGKYTIYKLPPGAINASMSPLGDEILWEWEEGADKSGGAEVVFKK